MDSNEVFVTIQGQRRYLWRAVDQDGDILDILVQSRRHCQAAIRFFRKLLKGQARQPGRLVTDKLSSYRAAHRAVMPSVAHSTDLYCPRVLGQWFDGIRFYAAASSPTRSRRT